MINFKTVFVVFCLLFLSNICFANLQDYSSLSDKELINIANGNKTVSTHYTVPKPPKCQEDPWSKLEEVKPTKKTSNYFDQFERINPQTKNSGFYPNETSSEAKQRVHNMYAHCKDRECIDRVYQENMKVLDQQERLLMYRMYENLYRENSSREPILIHYGYNAHGDYVPTSIGDEKIHYGYNSYGEYVPMSIGGD